MGVNEAFDARVEAEALKILAVLRAVDPVPLRIWSLAALAGPLDVHVRTALRRLEQTGRASHSGFGWWRYGPYSEA